MTEIFIGTYSMLKVAKSAAQMMKISYGWLVYIAQGSAIIELKQELLNGLLQRKIQK